MKLLYVVNLCKAQLNLHSVNYCSYYYYNYYYYYNFIIIIIIIIKIIIIIIIIIIHMGNKMMTMIKWYYDYSNRLMAVTKKYSSAIWLDNKNCKVVFTSSGPHMLL